MESNAFDFLQVDIVDCESVDFFLVDQLGRFVDKASRKVKAEITKSVRIVARKVDQSKGFVRQFFGTQFKVEEPKRE